jgi:glycogen debranching enzyme
MRDEAATPHESFEQVFWSKELSIYISALDGQKQPCRVKTSNAGHCLFGGIASPDRGRRVAQMLMEDGFFTGWGIHTVHASEAIGWTLIQPLVLWHLRLPARGP